MLVQKKQVKPIKLRGVNQKAMSQKDWSDLDKLTKSTIMLFLCKSVYFNVKATLPIMGKAMQPLQKNSVSSQIYWLKLWVDLKIKEGVSILALLNEFSSIFGQRNG